MKGNTDKKSLKYSADLSQEDVLRIWTMRAQGEKNKDIAAAIGCSEWLASSVIIGNVGPKTTVPFDIRKQALDTVHKKKKRASTNGAGHESVGTNGVGTDQLVLPISQYKTDGLLAEFLSACIKFQRYRRSCAAAGIAEKTLDGMYIAVQEQELADKEAGKEA